MRLKESRKATNLTQIQLSKILNVSQGQYSQWETGAVRPPEKYRDKLDKILVHSVDWDMEFVPLDPLEQRAALRLAAYLSEKGDETTAAELVFESTKYDLRKLLKASAYLPIDHSPGSYVVQPLLPPGLEPKMKRKGEK